MEASNGEIRYIVGSCEDVTDNVSIWAADEDRWDTIVAITDTGNNEYEADLTVRLWICDRYISTSSSGWWVNEFGELVRPIRPPGDFGKREGLHDLLT